MEIMKIENLEDGSLKIDSGAVSGPNHVNAEAFLRELERLGGVKAERKHKHGILGNIVHMIQHTVGGTH